MKAGNVILAIFLWLCIPAIVLLGILSAIPYSLSGGPDTGFTCICGPAILVFVIGLIVLIMGQEKTKEKQQPIYPKRRCPQCGRIIPEDAKICPYCGKKLTK